MIKGFEFETVKLSQAELNIARILGEAFNSRKPGGENAICERKISEVLKTKGINVSGSRIRKIINYMRNNEIVKGLCANNEGYFVEQTPEEFQNFIISLKQRVESHIYLYKNLMKQYNEKYGNSNEQDKNLNKPLI